MEYPPAFSNVTAMTLLPHFYHQANEFLNHYRLALCDISCHFEFCQKFKNMLASDSDLISIID